MVLKAFTGAVAGVFATLTTILVAGGLFVTFLATKGPLSVGFLTPQVQQALASLDLDLSVDVQDTVISWEGWQRRLDIRIKGLSFLTPEGELLSSIPEIGLSISGRKLLLGEVAVTRLSLYQPRLRIARKDDATLEIGLGEGPGDREVAAMLVQLLGGQQDDRQENLLESIEITDAEVAYRDFNQGLVIRAPALDLKLDRGAEGIDVRADGLINFRGAEAVFVVTSRFKGFGQDLPVNVAVSQVNLGEVIATLQDPRLEGLQVDGGRAQGAGRLLLDGEGRLKNAQLDFSVDAGVLSWEKYFVAPLEFGQLVAAMELDEKRGPVAVPMLSAVFAKGVSVEAAGSFELAEEGIGINLTGGFDNLNATDLKYFWPKTVASRAREWVRDHIKSGVVRNAEVVLDIRPGDFDRTELPERLVDLRFRFDNVLADYLDGFDPLRAASGWGRLSANQFEMAVDSGRIMALAVGEGQLLVSGLANRAPQLDIDLTARGNIQQLIEVLDSPQLGMVAELPFDVSQARGDTATRLRLRLPLVKDLKAADLGYSAATRLENLNLNGLFGRYMLKDGDAEVTLRPEGMRVTGSAGLEDLPIRFEWRKSESEELTPASSDVDDGGAGPNQLLIETVLDPITRHRFGLDFGAYLTGDIPLTLRLTPLQAGGFELNGAADLTPTFIHLPASGWDKPIGEPGIFSFSSILDNDDENIHLKLVTLDAGDLFATGEIRYNEKGLDFLRVDHLSLNENSLDFAVDMNTDGSMDVRIGGDRLDARAWIDDFVSEGQTGEIEIPIRLEFATHSVMLADDVIVADTRINANWREGTLERLSGRAMFDGGASLAVELTSEAGSDRRLDIWSGDGGSVIHALDFFHNAQGGRLQISAVIPPDINAQQPVKGRLRADDFQIKKVQALGRLLSEAKMSAEVDELAGDGIRFSRLEAPFEYDGERVILRRSRAVGPSMGLTLQGLLHRDSGALDMSGTIIPAYTLNSALGKIPFIGPFLIGGQVGGLFALTYQIKGTTENPEVSINPLSAFAPGFLRTIIEGLEAPVLDPEDNQDQFPKTPEK